MTNYTKRFESVDALYYGYQRKWVQKDSTVIRFMTDINNMEGVKQSSYILTAFSYLCHGLGLQIENYFPY